MRIGIDLGGTKIETIALGEDSRVIARQRAPTPRAYVPTLGAIADLVAAAEAQAGPATSIGLGIPGVVSRATGLVKNANSTWLIGQPLQADLESRLGRPLRIANDANCFALSEAVDGAGRGFDTVFGVILGTGVGGGIVVRRRILDGPNQIAGEWGHNQLPWMTDEEREQAPACYCGRSGCIETYLSGPGLERDHARASGVHRSSHAIVEEASRGDPRATASLRRYYDRLARALAGVINILDPDVVVLGGGMSNLPDLAAHVSALLPSWVFSDRVLTKVVPNVHGDSSGVRGAAWLWPEADDSADGNAAAL
jgi:fructokinase